METTIDLRGREPDFEGLAKITRRGVKSPAPAAAPLDTVRGLHDMVRERQRKIILDNRDPAFIMPATAVLVTASGDLVTILDNFTGDASKDAFAAYVRDIVGLTGAQRVAFASEIWTLAEAVTMEQMTANGFVRPSESPDRVEAMFVTCEDRDGTTSSSMDLLGRASWGLVTALIERDGVQVHGKDDKVTGRLAGWFR